MKITLSSAVRLLARPSVIALSSFLLLVFFGTSNVQAEESVGCQEDMPFEYVGSSNPAFENYERMEYVDGYLWIHFKFAKPIYGGVWKPGVVYVDDQCRTFYTDLGGYVYHLYNNTSSTLRNVSARFYSPNRFEFWNDDTNEKLTNCSNCEYGFYPVGSFFKVRIEQKIESSRILSTAVHTVENPGPSPANVGSTIELSAGCTPIETYGLFADKYEKIEYVNGFPWIHFRRSPFQDVDADFRIIQHDSDCNVVKSVLEKRILFPHFLEYYSVRFLSPTYFEIWDDTNNKMFTVCVQEYICKGSINNLLPDGTPASFLSFSMNRYFGSKSDFTRGFISTPIPMQEIEKKPDPVIIIPGILGSWEKNGKLVIDPVIHTYDNLIETLAANGYTKEKDLFTFPYEWRDSNVLSAKALRDKINEVQKICECSKVDLVAHSMGGLVARQYIQSLDYEGDVDQLIFLGTPHLGSPKAYLMWEGGELPGGFDSSVLKHVLKVEAKDNGYQSIFDYIRGRPFESLEQLLPIFRYIIDIDNVLKEYPENYPRNYFLENLKENNNLSSRTNIFNIVGDLPNPQTVINFKVKDSKHSYPLWEHGYPQEIILGGGDGTVTLNSAKAVSEAYTSIATNHTDLVSESVGIVYKTLTGKDASKIINKFRVPNILIIKLLSPVDMQIIAPDGKRIGKDFESGEEINEIEDAFYSGFSTDNEYATILNPLDGEYIIKTKGTDNGGEYTIASGLISDEGSSERDMVAYTLPGDEREMTLTIDSQSDEIAVEDATIIAQGDIGEHISQMIELGWISNDKFIKKLLSQTKKVDNILKKIDKIDHTKKNAPKRLVRLDKRLDKSTKRVIDKLLADGFKMGYINNEGYNLLLQDLQALML